MRVLVFLLFCVSCHHETEDLKQSSVVCRIDIIRLHTSTPFREDTGLITRLSWKTANGFYFFFSSNIIWKNNMIQKKEKAKKNIKKKQFPEYYVLKFNIT